MDREHITVSHVKIILSILIGAMTLSGTFFGGIEIAKSHADERISQLRQENAEKMDEITVILKEVYDKVADQKKDVEVIKVLMEERFPKKKS